jgi:16S rRNA (cytidine1402-2'-O)-methyltransferase
MSDYARDAQSEPRRDVAVRRSFNRREGGRADRNQRVHPEGGDASTRTATGTLFIVATPIGNLEDITLRALRVLREVAVVAAEDTRRSSQLLRHFNIETPLVSLHEHNERQRGEQLLARLLHGESVALVSDAGTPGISDPGALFVRAVREAGVRVDPIPGASAVTAILSASGLTFERYAFAGFPPIRSNDREQWFEWVATLRDVPVVGFEAPHRVEQTLSDLRSFFVNRPIIVARELTKVHEQWWFQPPNEAPSVPAKGEFTFIVGPEPGPSASADTATDEEVTLVFGQITETGSDSRRAAVKATATRLGIPARQVYAALERAKKTSQT